MFKCDRLGWLFLLSGCFWSVLASLATAQVTPDNTLNNENSTVTPNVTVKDAQADLIEGGAIRDNNLFHSFSEFNVGEGNAVYFANPDGVANILTRVTGNNVSNIFGTLGVDGAANLFLLNSNGIVFGENSVLDVNGSFLATTAESYILNEAGTKFSASNPDTAPLLDINLTPGLQMGSNPGQISVNGNGHRLIGGVFFPLQNNSPAPGLEIDRGHTLSLIGGEIELNGGIIKTAGGNIELTSVKQGKVAIDFDAAGEILDISQVEEFGDIKLSNRAFLDASGVFTGNINLKGNNIDLKDASAAIIQNLGFEPSGKLQAWAANSINLSGSVRNAPDTTTPQGNITGVTSSRFTTETIGIGKSGDILISGNNLSLDDGSSISARSFTNAATGDLNISFDGQIEINSSSTLNPTIPTLVSTTIFNSGNSGEINITAQDISFSNGGTISSFNFGSGKGGNIDIQVTNEFMIDGFDPIVLNPSALSSIAYRTGNSGKINVDAGRLSLLDGGRISSSTLAEGNGGQVTVNASDYIKISGTAPNKIFESSIASDAEVVDSALQQLLRVPEIPSGNSGNIILDTPQLVISDGGSVAVSNKGLGDSGNIMIASDRISLNDNASITAFSTSGKGGNIDLDLKSSLQLNNNSAVTAETTGNFADNSSRVNGGNIKIDTDIVTLSNQSQINANALQGNGGNITLTTQGLFVSNDSSISASSEFGLDGDVEVESINGDRPIELAKLSTDTIEATERVTTGCNSNSDFAIIGKGGLPNNPTQNLRGQATWQDLRLPRFSSNAPSTAKDISPATIIEAQTWQVNSAGRIELMAISSDNSRPNFNNHQCKSN